ncbi:hypothetical protein LTR37_013192 [Vermiconidia calcicola]|uniref:Uncharacterized protein n=1 Tax=Vermiconidia calcicola TaxID=1690605 RepID=A0ACC3MXL7_9PEZI|nr:hypothetical protein LTR37_013192 [Vermiconidia calcicola]
MDYAILRAKTSTDDIHVPTKHGSPHRALGSARKITQLPATRLYFGVRTETGAVMAIGPLIAARWTIWTSSHYRGLHQSLSSRASSPRLLKLKKGNQYSSSTREAATTSSTSRTSRTSKSSAEPVSTTSARTTITQEAVTTGQDGSVSTVTELITPVAAGSTETSNAQSSDDSGPNLGMIVGLAVGIPLVLIIAAILIIFLLRRRRKSKKYEVQSRPQSPPMEANYSNIAPGSHAPELDSYPVAPAQDKSGRKSELYGSDTYGHSPALSVSTNGSFPPQYSPGNRTEPMTQIQEEPQELWGGYVPYRPPRTQ